MQNDAKVQAVFDTVIAAGIYPDVCSFMCLALPRAVTDEVISQEDATMAERAIDAYLAANGKKEPAFTLLDFLGHGDTRDVRLGVTTYCLPIYKDWKNRPLRKS